MPKKTQEKKGHNYDFIAPIARCKWERRLAEDMLVSSMAGRDIESINGPAYANRLLVIASQFIDACETHFKKDPL